MAWRGPEYEGEFPSLGYEVAQFIQDRCVIPDREHAGEPFVLTDEQLKFLVFHYALNPETGRWRHERGSQVIRPRKWGKAPLTAAMVCAEAAGPVLFDGWDASGEPVGKPWPTPFIQCVACSADQVANVWRVLVPMIQLGGLDADIPDTGDTRINLPNGRIEPVTASARSRVGQRTTFAVMDETQMWVESNGGHKLEGALKDNLAGTGGRFIETCNAFDPVEQSVAQMTFEANDPHVYRDDADPPAGDVNDFDERDRVLEAVYGDSLRSPMNPRGWIDKQRIHIEIEARLAKGQGEVAERMFMNRKLAASGAAFDVEKWAVLARKDFHPPKGDVVTIGVDGARHDDALAVVACHVKSGFVWPLVVVERPLEADENYGHDLDVVDAAVREAFDRWQVWRLYADPQHIGRLIEGWSNSYGDKRVHEWATYRPRQIAFAVRNFEQAIARGDLSHDGSDVLTRHVRQSRKRMLTVRDDEESFMHTLAKDNLRSPRKIDAAMAAVLAWEARGDCIAAGAVRLEESPEAPKVKPRKPWRPGFAPDMTGTQPVVGVAGPMSDMT
jgi:hypothetical protein